MPQIISLSTKITESFELNEAYKNLFQEEEKRKYADEVWDVLQQTYKNLPGGLAGSGFESKENMITKIPFWKLTIRSGKVVSVGMYKDKGGRKRVASGTDGTEEGKAELMKTSIEDIKSGRAYAEVSKGSLAVLNKLIDLTKYAIPPDVLQNKLRGKKFGPVPEDDFEYKKYPHLRDLLYSREIGGEFHTKLAVGNVNSDPIIH